MDERSTLRAERREGTPWHLGDLPDLLADRCVAVAESCTAGQVATELARVGDAASWLAGGVVAYQTSVKRSLLQVAARSVGTAEAAGEMARGVAELLGADVAIATTGVIGTDAVDGIEPGTVFIATLVDDDLLTRERRVYGTPDERCEQATKLACTQLVRHLDPSSDRAATGDDRDRRRLGDEHAG